VLFRRGGVPEPVVVRLVDCAGQPSSDALAALSALAQPPADGGELQQLNPGLLVRLQRIAERFPGHAIDVVSGLRPKARPGSRHRSGDALDIRIEGVGEAELAELARTLEGTGVGFYPNSTFVHIDVRVEPAYWVDRSHPGEPPDYGPWPPATDGAATPATETVEPPAAPDTVEAAAEPMMKTAEPPAGTGAAEVGATDTVEPPAATDTIEPPAATDAIEPPAATDTVEPAAEDPELQALADRALWVMNRELGGDERDDSGMLEPEPATELL
jgi:hypothetical protein